MTDHEKLIYDLQSALGIVDVIEKKILDLPCGENNHMYECRGTKYVGRDETSESHDFTLPVLICRKCGANHSHNNPMAEKILKNSLYGKFGD